MLRPRRGPCHPQHGSGSGLPIDVDRQWFRDLSELRYDSTPKRLRASLDGRQVLDTRDALLVWEPRRVVPWYAVPAADLALSLTEHERLPPPSTRAPVLGPRHNDRHTVPEVSLRLDGNGEVAFRPDEPELGGRVILNWDLIEWREEDEAAMSHPHDPFKRIDVLCSDGHVVVELDGVVLAESSRPMMLVETSLPVRWYLPREDVRTDLLTPSDHHTVCAYKGVASDLSADGAPNIAWSYPEPLHYALRVKDLICFWRPATIRVDGESADTSMPGE